MPPDNTDCELLRQLTQQPAASQRSLAAHLGASVGKINDCPAAQVAKGLVKARTFRRSDNKLARASVLMPARIEEDTVLAKAFPQGKVTQFNPIQRVIDALRIQTREAIIDAPPAEGSHLDLACARTALRVITPIEPPPK